MWLLESTTFKTLERIHASGFVPTAAQITHCQSLRAEAVAAPKTTTIPIKGVLTKEFDIISALFGGGNTVYSDVVGAIQALDADPNVSNITLDVDSPGGQFDGLFEVLDAMGATKTPITAKISGSSASAAYAITSRADKVIAGSRANRIGSVGVVASFEVNDSRVDITSTHAPRKRPDIKTEEGVAMVREELDSLHQLFAESIAEGRGTSVKKVNADFGQGAMLLARDALKAGMIDAIGEETPETTTTASGGNNIGESPMDIKTLQTEHAGVYAAVLALGVADGVSQEKDRVSAHLTLGACGDMTAAIAAVKDGSGITETVRATHIAASMRTKTLDARDEEDIDPGQNIDTKLTDEQASAKLLAATAEAAGIELGE